MQSQVAERLKAMPYAETKGECEHLRDPFVGMHHKTDKKAVETLLRDCDRMVIHYTFPRQHWEHGRTTNIVESPSPQCGSAQMHPAATSAWRKTRAIIQKVLWVAEPPWRTLHAPELLPLVSTA